MPAQDEADERKERRRVQNVVAQRAYRAKQKERLRRLERLTVEALARSNLSGAGPDTNRNPILQPQDTQSLPTPRDFQQLRTVPIVPSPDAAPSLPLEQDPVRGWVLPVTDRPNQVTATALGKFIHGFTAKEKQTFHLVVMREKFTISDMVKYGLIHLGSALDPELAEAARHAPTSTWLRSVRNALGDIDIVAVIAAGIKLLANLNVPSDQLGAPSNFLIPHLLTLADSCRSSAGAGLGVPPMPRSLTFTAEAYAAAVFANASMLDISFDELSAQDEEYPSPPCPHAKPDLIPTPSQMVVPHHRAFDTLPWPIFREKLCQAIACNPPLIDDEELCLDLLNDGVVCWGSATGSMHGRGMGAPWDSRSWEAAPWFLEKYEILTDGRDGEIWKNSEWWRAMRS